MIIREARITDTVAICRISSEDLGYECENVFVKERLKNLDASREVVFVAEAECEKYNAKRLPYDKSSHF